MAAADLLPPAPGRLPPTAIPSHYDLHYTKIDLLRHTFEGVVSISVDIPARPALLDAIVLHSIDLAITEATYASALPSASPSASPSPSGSAALRPPFQAFEYRYHTPTQTCALLFPPGSIQPATAGQLSLRFRGVLNDLMHGLYRSTYTSLDGRELTIATTQFEPTDARRAFPCFDEPALKAAFRLTVSLDADEGRPALRPYSNTAVTNERTEAVPVPGRRKADGSPVLRTVRTTEFGTTPVMSTYLVALVVAELDGISSTPDEDARTAGVVTTVYTVPGRAEGGRFCLDVAGRCLELFSVLFGVAYPLSKSDLVAVPDFAAGAMENFGLVTYREAKVLVREGETSESARRGIARTVCHELAHMWFGNLVTPEFWTQLWLKEGVARYMEFVAIDRLFPEWDAWTEFVQGVYSVAQNLDAMRSSHPVEVEVRSADEIGEIFDSISYAKGASVIRMVASYVGSEAFFRGMRHYLEAYKYSNTLSEQFWQALEDASGKPVVELALPWTLSVGYPILLLPEEGSPLRTPRYLASGPKGSHDGADEGTVWPMPVTAIVEGEDGPQGPWLINGPSGDESKELLEKIDHWSAAGKWFKLNASQAGFYRVRYTSDQWKALGRALSPSGPLSGSDILGLISDSFGCGRAGYSSIVDSLALVKAFGEHNEAEYAVWQELSENLAALASLYRSESFFPRFQSFIQEIYTKQMGNIGWDAKEGEAQRTGTLRATVINMLAMAGDESVCVEALRRFRLFISNPASSPIPGDLRLVLFRAALRQDEGYVYSELMRIYEQCTFPEELRNCLATLGRVKDSSRHAEMLKYTLYSGKVRFQDIALALNGLATTTDEGGRVCWRNMTKNFDLLASKFREGHVVWGTLIGLTCRGLRTAAEADEVEAFFADPMHPMGAGERRLHQALEAVRTKAERIARDRWVVEAFLDLPY